MIPRLYMATPPASMLTATAINTKRDTQLPPTLANQIRRHG
jgi:hypothetical protein